MSTRKKVFFSLVVALMIAALSETTAFVAASLLRTKAVFYDPPDCSKADYYFARRDPELGWPSPMEIGGKNYDASGSRPIPSFPEPGHACVSIYGDSFTYGAGVSHEAAWSNRLSELLGCRVSNYGVGGYGSDQAEIRFERNVADEAPVTILGHLSENVLRNVSRYRRLMAAGDEYGLKPRFDLDPERGLIEIPIAGRDAEEVRESVLDPEARLAHDYFVPGGPSGVARLRFPYTLSVLRALRHYHVRAELAGQPAYTEFYRSDHPSHGLEITARIVERFAARARERDKLPMVMVIPTGLDLLEFQRSGTWIYEPLLSRTRELGVDVVNIGSLMMETIGSADPCALYIRCNNHFNEAGNRLLAEEVLVAIDQRRIRQIAASDGRWTFPISLAVSRDLPPVAVGPP